ncbi:hypothetical protein EVJ58_g2798 [Rhodofomes roseus]|nr:hypothetical protein EVJ58_g2798 [Rhodofomes roseus]
MPNIVELVIVDLKEGVGKDDPVFTKLREGVAKGGLKRQSFGFSVEHPQRLYWTFYFENGFEPKDFKWPQEEYGDYIEQLKTIATSDFTRYYFTFPSFPHEVTAAPITETALITLKADADVAAFKAIQDALVGKLKQAPVVQEAAYAITTEAGANPIVLLFVGWPSAEAHQELVSRPESKEVMGKLHSFIEKGDVAHIPYTNKEY